ncbi:MAG: glutaredoxin family protein [Anaerolineales bacterium]
MHFTKFRTLSIWTLLLVVSSLVLTVTGAGAAPPQQEAEPVVLYFFWGEACPHCAQQKPFLDELGERYPNLEVRSYEIYHVEENRELFLEMAATVGFEARAVPTTIVGERHWVGYSEEIAQEIEAQVAACSASGCPDAGAGFLPESAPPTPVPAPPLQQGEAEPVVLYFFWGEGCPHCAQQKPFLDELGERYPNLEVRSYEIYRVEENRELFLEMAATVGFEARAVPTTIVGERHWVGYSEEIAREIEAQVAACSASGCPDAGAGLAAVSATPTPAPPPPAPEEPGTSPETSGVETPEDLLTLPLIGTIDLGAQSVVVSTAIIAFVDGFNPCSLWVLSILISLTLRTGSRKKVFVTGFTFLSVTSLIYGLFIAGLFTIFSFVSFMGWIQIVVALLALLFAAVNIKDYFWYKEGLSFTISDEKKPGLYKQMRKVMSAESLWAMLTTTVVMAVGIALVELPCTAGFPVIWTNLLAAQGVEQVTFVLLLLLYMLIYLLDELAVFLIAVLTLRSSKMEEKHGRVLKLIGGMLMLTLAAVMLIDPVLMNNVSSTLIIFAVAFGVSMLVLLLHRKVLPHFGIYIGTELEASGSK